MQVCSNLLPCSQTVHFLLYDPCAPRPCRPGVTALQPTGGSIGLSWPCPPCGTCQDGSISNGRPKSDLSPGPRIGHRRPGWPGRAQGLDSDTMSRNVLVVSPFFPAGRRTTAAQCRPGGPDMARITWYRGPTGAASLFSLVFNRLSGNQCPTGRSLNQVAPSPTTCRIYAAGHGDKYRQTSLSGPSIRDLFFKGRKVGRSGKFPHLQ